MAGAVEVGKSGGRLAGREGGEREERGSGGRLAGAVEVGERGEARTAEMQMGGGSWGGGKEGRREGGESAHKQLVWGTSGPQR